MHFGLLLKTSKIFSGLIGRPSRISHQGNIFSSTYFLCLFPAIIFLGARSGLLSGNGFDGDLVFIISSGGDAAESRWYSQKLFIII